jgi:hypothetical protein
MGKRAGVVDVGENTINLKRYLLFAHVIEF